MLSPAMSDTLQDELPAKHSEIYAALLETLCDRLPSTAQTVEDRTCELSERFRVMAQNVQHQGQELKDIIHHATHIMLKDDKVSLSDFLDMFTDLLTDSVEQTLRISKTAMAMVYSMDGAINNLQHVEKFIGNIQHLNNKARILSLNATIEAEHAGEIGKGFGVVAKEMKQMSTEISGLSDDMQQRINTVSSSVREGYSFLQDIADIDMSTQINTKERLDELMQCMLQQSTMFQQKLSESAGQSSLAADNINEMIMGMQFQDRNSQYIDNSVKAIGLLARNIEQEETSERMNQQEMIDHLSSCFSLSEFKQQFLHHLRERNLLAQSDHVVLLPAAETSDNADDSVELF